MFDRFAGVFHAFERLREHVETAVREKRSGDAVYRLFGAKHDSLPSLLDRVLSDDDEPSASPATDPATRLAVRYATILSAQRLLRQLEQSIGSFLAEHAADVKKLRRTLSAQQLRERVARECGQDGSTFVDWFDDWFLGRRERGEA